MALRKLVEDDCGGSNSLIRFTRHFIEDRGLKEEGLHNAVKAPLSDSDQLVEQFLEEQFSSPQTFRMDNLLQEMREIDQNILPPIPAPGVIKELTGLDTAWANQYLESGRHFDEHHADEIWHTTEAAPTEDGLVRITETHELGLHPKWAEEYLEHSIDAVESEGGTVKDRNLLSKDNESPTHSKFMKFMQQEDGLPIDNSQTQTSVLKEVDEKWVEEFEGHQNESENVPANVDNDIAVERTVEEETSAASNWADEFAKDNALPTDVDNYESAFWARLQNEWDKISSAENLQTTHPWISEYEKYYDPFKDYQFNEKNPMKALANALDEGKRRLAVGDLPSAVLCFEAAVQQDENNAEAWLLLGKTQAENEQDPFAISALKRCLSLDPSNGVALMALAVSYTNESYQNQACTTLKEWLLRNDKYRHLMSNSKSNAEQHPKTSVSTILFNDVHEEVKKLFIEAARMNPQNEIDPDVQCGLGVLFNLSNEYDKAADCFQAALQARPDDSRLWNRLGATLANGQRSEEAVNAYHRALELSPGFIRARYNLGISCINLGAYKEAGEHLLIALNQQAAGRGTQGENIPPRAMSNTIWSTLRLVISLMHKYHLNEAIENRDLDRLNKEFEIA